VGADLTLRADKRQTDAAVSPCRPVRCRGLAMRTPKGLER